MPNFGNSRSQASEKLWAKAWRRGDLQIKVYRPEAHAKRLAQDDIEEKLSPGYKAWKKDKERADKLNLELSLREKYANEDKDALERQLRASREAAGRRLTLVTAPSPDENPCELEAITYNGYGHAAHPTYRHDRECPLHSEHGTERFEFPREVPNRPENQAGWNMNSQRYDNSQPHGARYDEHPGRYFDGSDSYVATSHHIPHYELEGEMPAAHLSTVTRGGPYELSEQHYPRGYEASSAKSKGNWI